MKELDEDFEDLDDEELEELDFDKYSQDLPIDLESDDEEL